MNKLYTLCLAAILILSMSSLSSQLFKTNLKVTVRNDAGNLESGVKVTLYKTKEDFDKSANAFNTQTTDDKGNARFDELEPTVYYINAEKGDKNNYGAGEKIDSLIENKLNKVTIIISE